MLVRKLEMFCRGHTFSLCNRMTCNYLYLSFLHVIIDICCMTLFEIPELFKHHEDIVKIHALTAYRPAARFHPECVCLAFYVALSNLTESSHGPFGFTHSNLAFEAKPLTGFDRQK